MASEAQVEANRQNGLQGGPKTAEGKAHSRLNALKHGIWASAFTPKDQDSLAGLRDELVAFYKPQGPVERMMLEQMALCSLRIARCAAAEAVQYERAWAADADGVESLDIEAFERMVRTLGRYSTTLTNQFLKLVKELEKRQAARAAEGGAEDCATAGLPSRADVGTVGGHGRTSQPWHQTQNEPAPNAPLQNEPKLPEPWRQDEFELSPGEALAEDLLHGTSERRRFTPGAINIPTRRPRI